MVAGLAAVTAILVAVISLAYGNSRQFRASSERAAHIQEAILNLERLLATVVDAETGMRGYLLSGEESYLSPYTSAVEIIDASMAQLEGELRALGFPAETAGALKEEVEQQIDFRREVVERVMTAGESNWVRLSIRLDDGKSGMDRIRQLVTDTRLALEKLALQGRIASEQIDNRFLATLVGLAIAIAALMLGGFALVRHHLTERRRLEAERDSFFNISSDMYCIAGADGFFKQSNRSATRMLGYTEEELTAVPFLDFVHPDDRTNTAAEAQKLAEGLETVDFENRYRVKAGGYKWLLWTASPSPDRKTFYCVARDVTEQKKAERHILDMAEDARKRALELEGVNQELEAFSYSVSHDLRAPLRHIAGFADMLQKHAEKSLDAKSQRFIKTIMDSAKRMGMLIDDLLVFSRMGRAEMRREKVDFNTMIDGIIADLAPDIGSRNIVWKREPLPQVMGDRAMLQQVFVNLIANAIKYSGPRDPAIIEIKSHEEKNEYIFCVSDNGVGFDMAYAHKLFGVFQRLHEASQFEGTGIGLANVRRIVSRHGGRVWAEAELDKGAAFHFSLPKA